MGRGLRLLAFALLLALAAAAAIRVGRHLRRGGSARARPIVFFDSAEEFEKLFVQGRARRIPRETPPLDPVLLGPRSREDLLPYLTPREIDAFFASGRSPDMAADELSYYGRAPDIDTVQFLDEYPGGEFPVRTNSLGMRRDDDPASARPALRVLVTGDSHIDGVLPNARNLCAILEKRLLADGIAPSVEVLDAAVGGYTFVNELGRLERFADLWPQVFVAIVYGGNDWYGQVVLERYLRGFDVHCRQDVGIEDMVANEPGLTGVLAQDLLQALHFFANPEDEELAVQTSLEYLLAMRERCRELDARFLCVYLPPASATQYERYEELYGPALVFAHVDREVLAISDRLADRMLAGLARAGVPTVDLRPALRDAEPDCYWRADLHLSVLGHSIAANAMYRSIVALARAASH